MCPFGVTRLSADFGVGPCLASDFGGVGGHGDGWVGIVDAAALRAADFADVSPHCPGVVVPCAGRLLPSTSPGVSRAAVGPTGPQWMAGQKAFGWPHL